VIALLLSFVLALQGIPVQAQQAGKVSGVLKDAQGKPIPGIRIAAIARPELLDEAITSPAMSSLAETDDQGRYTLESIPPGRYLIAAGRLDVQTYYPGTADVTLAKDVQITPGLAVPGIDFTLGDSSFGRAGNGGGLGSSNAIIPLRVTMEGGGKIPLSAGGKFVYVKLDMGTSVITTPIANSTISVPGPQTTAYRVTIENLPDTYVVKSIVYGTADLSTNTLRLTPSNFPGPGVSVLPIVNLAPTPNTSQTQLPQTEQDLLNYLTGLAVGRGLVSANSPASLQAYQAGLAAGLAGRAAVAPTPSASSASPSVLYVTLVPVPAKARDGVRVSGQMSIKGNRTVFVSGIPGTVYSDGTFDVYGIPPGRHTIVTPERTTLAASVVVESSNLDGIVLNETAMLPIRAVEPAPPRSAAGHPVGSVPLARVTGVLMEELAKTPIPEGTIIIKTNGYYSASFSVDAEGRFELPPLLPGTYDLEVQIFGHSNIKQSFEIDDKDMKLELSSRKLY